MYLGVDYYPEQWSTDIIDEDLDNILELGSNVIRIGEFAWHLMEINEGNYDFSYFDMVIEKAKNKGLKIIFGTPTATMPAWLAKKYPEVLSEFEDNSKRVFGGRRQYCFNSKVYQEYSKKIISELAKHYKNENQIVAWQIDNEFGHEGSDVCYCDNCKKEFRNYLRDKFENNINILNEEFGTIFWSQTYNDFDEIPIPIKTIATHNPSLSMEWERFRSWSIEKYAKMQVELLKEILGDEAVVIHDFSGGYFDKSYDFSKVANHLDIVAYNNYPVWGGQANPIPSYEIACGLDFMRGAKKQNFWITEAIMGAQGHNVIGYLPRPNQAKMWSYQAIAHGCSSLMYFRYRGAIKGSEQFCYGIIDSDNKKRRKFYEVKSFFEEMNKNKDLVESQVKSSVGLIYDYDSMASFRIQQQSSLMDYKNEVYRLYRPFYEKNINIDVIPSDSNFDDYEVLLIPVMIVHNPKVQEKIRDFAQKGKIVVISFRNSVKDYYNNLTLNKFNPINFTDFIGGYVEEIEAFQQNQSIGLNGVGEFEEVVGSATVFRDLIKTTTAKTLFNYDDEFFSDLSAITVNNYNDANIYYIGCGVDNNIMDKLCEKIIKESNLEFIESPIGVEVVKRNVNNKIKYFVMNHTDKVQTLGLLNLKPYEATIVDKIN